MNILSILIVSTIFISCEEEDTQYPIVQEGDPCFFELPNTSIWQDFDCFQNVEGSGALTTVENPNMTGINTSSNAGAFNDDGTNGWDNLQFNFGSPIDLSSKSTLKMSVLSEKAVQFLTKIEGGAAKEIWSPVIAVGEWTEYSFDYSSAIGSGNSKLVLFFNAGKGDGTADDIYYIDNLRWE